MNQPNKHRTHLFSPHTDQCIYCGKSAEDDAIGNTPCGCDEVPPCEACGGKGWFYFNARTDQSPRYEVQRCDVCEQYSGDLAALEAAEKASLAQPVLLKFIEGISQLKHEKEPGDDEAPFRSPAEDSIATLNRLIMNARQLLGTADKCDVCGTSVPYVIGCPGGAEICQDCFDAGQH
jgi:hypothetical protein